MALAHKTGNWEKRRVKMTLRSEQISSQLLGLIWPYLQHAESNKILLFLQTCFSGTTIGSTLSFCFSSRAHIQSFLVMSVSWIYTPTPKYLELKTKIMNDNKCSYHCNYDSTFNIHHGHRTDILCPTGGKRWSYYLYSDHYWKDLSHWCMSNVIGVILSPLNLDIIWIAFWGLPMGIVRHNSKLVS